MRKFETVCHESLSSSSKSPSQGQYEDNNIDQGEEEKEEEHLEGRIVISKQPDSEASTPPIPSSRKKHHKVQDDEEYPEGRIVLSKQPGSEASTPNPSSRKEQHKVEDEEDDDDGIRTPTSLDHRIPVVAKQCPPAPRKPKPSLKRKASHSSCSSCRHPLDLSKEVELLFPTQHNQLLSDHSHQSTKKVRREGAL